MEFERARVDSRTAVEFVSGRGHRADVRSRDDVARPVPPLAGSTRPRASPQSRGRRSERRDRRLAPSGLERI